MSIRQEYSLEERAAIGELLEFVQVLATSESDAVRVAAALGAERAANMIRGDAPRTWTNKDIVAFAETWNVKRRARFNPAPKRRRG